MRKVTGRHAGFPPPQHHSHLVGSLRGRLAPGGLSSILGPCLFDARRQCDNHRCPQIPPGVPGGRVTPGGNCHHARLSGLSPRHCVLTLWGPPTPSAALYCSVLMGPGEWSGVPHLQLGGQRPRGWTPALLPRSGPQPRGWRGNRAQGRGTAGTKPPVRLCWRSWGLRGAQRGMVGHVGELGGVWSAESRGCWASAWGAWGPGDWVSCRILWTHYPHQAGPWRAWG